MNFAAATVTPLAVLAGASAQQQAPAAAGCERILWVQQDQATPAVWAQVKALGFTAVNFAPGQDPAPLLAAGLRGYLDQPAGKGLLELRDEQWQPLRDSYERTRDPAVLIRPLCLQDPAAVAAAAARVTAAVQAVPAGFLLFVALADEASVTRHGNPLDLCRCSRCLSAFRAFLRARHGELGRLNEAWGSVFVDWSEVEPLTTDQVRRRELGGVELPANLRPWSEHLEFTDQQFSAAVASLRQAVTAVAKGLPVGLTGLQAPAAFGGHDYARLLPGLSLVEAYDVGGARDLAQALLPAALQVVTLFPPGKEAPARLPTAQLASAALHGCGGVVVWNAATVLRAGAATTPYGGAVAAGLAQLGAVLDATAGAQVQRGPVWLVESQASVRAWWMLDSAADGMTWVRRLTSYEENHSTSLAARRSWTRLLQDLGLQPQFVADTELPERLLRERPRCLVLPASIALADRTCQAIEAYVWAGGTLLADHSVALYDQQLQLRERGALDALFGLAARSRRWDDLLVCEGHASARSRLHGGAAAVEAGLELMTRAGLHAPPVAETQGEFKVSIEQTHEHGRTVYLDLAVCEYDQVRLDPARTATARDLRARVRQVLQSAGIKPPFDVHGKNLPTCLERAVLHCRSGRTVYGVRVHALDRPAILAELARAGATTVTLQLPLEQHLRLLSGDDLGTATSFELTLDPFAGLFVEEVPR
ncbi:MAG TPA: alpha-amylase family protein [Planctomycetota bacterium]|nr:alpha-amylase family protein [Planctomycetota bacterium]